MHIFGAEPTLFGAAFAGPELVGIVLPELKVTIVPPEHRRRGVGRRLVQLGLALESARGRPELFMGSVPEDPGGAAFLQATGFTFHSTVWDLDLPMEREVPAAVWPDGLRARSFDRAIDVSRLRSLVNEAFADHPTPMVMEEAMVQAFLADPNILDPDTIVVEDLATAELIGFCLTDVRRASGVVTAQHGEIGMVGVRPDRQGRGLGRQLLRAGATYLRAVGTPFVGLAVNGRNEAALGLYESEGYVRRRTRDRWTRPVISPE